MTLTEKLAQIAADQGQILSVTQHEGYTSTVRKGPDPLVPALARALGVAVKALEQYQHQSSVYAQGISQYSEAALALHQITEILEVK